jgi:hypothetical protein
MMKFKNNKTVIAAHALKTTKRIAGWARFKKVNVSAALDTLFIVGWFNPASRSGQDLQAKLIS